jgi:hypothetical protein
MTVKDLEGLYDYGYWANQKLFQNRIIRARPTGDGAGEARPARNHAACRLPGSISVNEGFL